MTIVETARGPVDSSELGRTYMHEHVFVRTADMQANYPSEWGDEEARVAEAVAQLRALAAHGVRTIVDPTVVGLGRDVARVRRVAEQVPELNIVVATGIYTHDSVPFWFRHRGPGLVPTLPEPMVELFVADITEGIGTTGVKAGMLKCAIDEPGLTPGVERVMRAVAEAHRRTGVPLTVHTHPGTRAGLDAKRVLCDEEGVPPNLVVLAHSGDSTDVDHLSDLAEAGFVLGMDRFGLNHEVSFEERASTLVEMCRRGFADRMVLSQDAACYIDWIEPWAREALPQWHYLHIAEDVLPYVLGQGVTEEDVSTMLVEVPRRLLEGAPASSTLPGPAEA